MRILFLSDNFPPEVNAPATRTYEHCVEWVKLGAEVTVITCNPNYPKGKLYDGYKNWIYQKEEISGIRVIRVWSYMTPNEGFVKRTLDFLSFAFMATVIGMFIRTDIIIATSPQFFTTFSGFLLSKLKRKPWVFELRDLWPDTIRAVGAVNNERILSLLEKIELFLYKSATSVIPVTEYFKQNLISRGIEKDKIKVITNGANLTRFTPRQKNSGLIDKYKLNNKFVIGYVGTLGMTHGLDFILKSIKCIDDQDFYFIFIGSGAEKQGLIELSNELNLENVLFIDTIPKDEVVEHISIFDIGLVPLKNSPVFKTVIPSKIFEQAAMGIPILLGVDGQAKEIIEQFNAGLFFEPENESDFLEKLRILRKDLLVYEKCRKGCYELASAYDRKLKAVEMLEYLQKIVK